MKSLNANFTKDKPQITLNIDNNQKLMEINPNKVKKNLIIIVYLAIFFAIVEGRNENKNKPGVLINKNKLYKILVSSSKNNNSP